MRIGFIFRICVDQTNYGIIPKSAESLSVNDIESDIVMYASLEIVSVNDMDSDIEMVVVPASFSPAAVSVNTPGTTKNPIEKIPRTTKSRYLTLCERFCIN